MNNSSKLVALLESKYQEARIEGFQGIRETLIAGLNWETSYWVDCALNWIEQGADIDEEINERLKDIASNKNYEQRTRHRATAISNRWLHARNT